MSTPILTGGAADPGGSDPVASDALTAVYNASARLGELEADTYGQGSVIGDLLTFAPSPLDPGVGSLGETEAAGSFFDPPRNYGGAP